MIAVPRRRPLLVLGSIATALCVVVACSDSAHPSAGATTSGSGQDASTDRNLTDPDSSDDFRPDAVADAGHDAAIVCPVPALGGSVISARYVGGVPPDDMGGTIMPGTYDLTDLEIYLGLGEEGDPDGGPDAGATDTAQATFVITTDMLKLSKKASPLGGGAPNITTVVAMQHVSDVFLVTDETCPSAASRQTPFTATATTVTLHTAQTRREVYTRRP